MKVKKVGGWKRCRQPNSHAVMYKLQTAYIRTEISFNPTFDGYTIEIESIDDNNAVVCTFLSQSELELVVNDYEVLITNGY